MRRLAACALLSLLAGPLAGQSAARPDPFLDRLIGRWVLSGPMAGKTTTHDVTFRWVLGHEYVEMHEVSRERKADGTPAYEAIVYLVRDPGSRRYVALWLDNTAAAAFHPTGIGPDEAAGDSIPFIFQTSDSEFFRNTFVYDRAAGTWQWHMDDVRAGVADPFARVTLRRR